ncbi:integral membrane protein [Fructobacillus pseudoficulneus]|uniref:Integral membrane protein n=1 Tax=Fructobacillus pseudoficulneus TaxID=220714 RepID=A0A3F3H4J6_9LACO|nr:AI-2E family transporter [Fructobacillus pseudoficulneus]GAP02930.1 integral membrane protein [Fructobacillus pseudoficulneus]SEH45015.1 Predicted PurR-regulated permease PerM [Fructobacillus pseudoficulneus]
MFPNDKFKHIFFWTIEALALACLIFLVFRFDFLMHPLAVFANTVFMPLLVAGFLYYVLKPIMKAIEKIKIKGWQMPRTLAVWITFTLFLLVVVGAFVIFVPLILNEITNMIASLPSVIRHAQNYANEIMHESWFKRLNITISDDEIKNTITKYGTSLLSLTAGTLQSVIMGTTSFTINALMVPIILFYMLNDADHFLPAVKNFFPKNKAKDVFELGGQLDKTIERYISGQAIQMVFVGFAMSIGYWLTGLPYIWLLGFVAGVANIVPYVGPFIGVIPAVVVALSISWKMTIGIAITMAIVQQVNGSIIYPALIGKSLKIHPLTVMLLLLGAGNLWGMVGMIIVVPVYAIIRTIALYAYKLHVSQNKNDAVLELVDQELDDGDEH